MQRNVVYTVTSRQARPCNIFHNGKQRGFSCAVANASATTKPPLPNPSSALQSREPLDTETLGYLRLQDQHLLHQIRSSVRNLNSTFSDTSTKAANIPHQVPLPTSSSSRFSRSSSSDRPRYTDTLLRQNTHSDLPMARDFAAKILADFDVHIRDLLAEEYITVADATRRMGEDGSMAKGARASRWQIEFDEELAGMDEADKRLLLKDLMYQEEAKVNQLKQRSRMYSMHVNEIIELAKRPKEKLERERLPEFGTEGARGDGSENRAADATNMTASEESDIQQREFDDEAEDEEHLPSTAYTPFSSPTIDTNQYSSESHSTTTKTTTTTAKQDPKLARKRAKRSASPPFAAEAAQQGSKVNHETKNDGPTRGKSAWSLEQLSARLGKVVGMGPKD